MKRIALLLLSAVLLAYAAPAFAEGAEDETRRIARGRGAQGHGAIIQAPPNGYPDSDVLEIAIRLGDQLEQMAVGVLEIDAAAAEMTVDAAGLLFCGIGPDLTRALADACERAVELFLADEKREVLQCDRLGLGRQVIDRDVVGEIDDEKPHEATRRR